MKVNNMKAVIFDIEGVLIDVSERLKLCLEETGKKFGKIIRSHKELKGNARKYFWNCFMSEKYLEFDKPLECNIELAKKLQENYKLILITGARDEIARVHEKRLRNYGLRFIIFSRPKGNRLPSAVFKRRIIEELINEGYEIEKVFEDDEENCEMFLRYAKEVYIVKGCEVKLYRKKLNFILQELK